MGARVVAVVNRRARRLEANAAVHPLLDVLRARRSNVRVIETHSIADLDAAADELAREVPDAIVLAGGDGSYMAGITALVRSFAAAGRSPDALPPFALAPGGTVSTVARNWGFRGGGLFSGGEERAARYAERLLDAVSQARATETPRPTLRATDDHAERVGFIFGAGLVSRFFEVYDEEGARGYRGAASIVARIFAGSFSHGALAERVLTPVPCILEVDGVRAPEDRASLVCASVVRDLGIGMHLLYRAGEEHDRFHVVATPLGPAKLGPQMPLVLMGRPLLGRSLGNVDTLARRLELRFEGGGAYVLDGELLRTDRVVVTAGPVLRILSVREAHHHVRDRERFGAMRDDDDGALAAQPRDGREHALLSEAVERARRLVEEEHREARRERTCDGDPLALAARDCALGHERSIAHGRDEALGAELREEARHELRTLVRRSAVVLRAEHDVRDERIGEHGRVLRDPRERPLVRADAALRQHLLTPRDRACTRHVEAEQRAHQRRLADARRTDDRRYFPWWEGERERLVRAVAPDEAVDRERRERPLAGSARTRGARRGRRAGCAGSRCSFARVVERVLGTSPDETPVDQLAERLVRHEEGDRERDDRAAIDAADRPRSEERERDDESERAEHLARVRDERRPGAQT
jgi:diacylglycerol kinase family enzyme